MRAPSRSTLALLVAGLVLAATAALAALSFSSPFVAMLRAGRQLALLALVVAGFTGWGAQLCRWMNADGASWIAKGGLGATVTATVMGYLAPWWFADALFAVPWVLVGCGLLVVRQRSSVAAAPHADTNLAAASPSAGVSTGAPLLWAATLIFLAPALLVALAPPIALDALVYHLAIPRQAALLGRLPDMPWLAYSHFPLHAEMLYGLALALGGGVLAQLLHLAAAAAAVVTAARAAARWFGPAAGPWTALLLASAPVLAVIAGAAGNDWFVVLYLALALEHHARVDDDRSFGVETSSRHRLEAIFLGASIATKYTALPALVLLVMPRRGFSPRRLAGAAALVLVVALPWYGRNLLLRGNPVYPLASDSPAAAALSGFRGGENGLGARLRGYLFSPDLVDEMPGLLLPAATVLAAIVLPGRRRVPPALPVLAATYMAPLVWTHPTARSFAPLLLVLAILGGGAVAVVATTRASRIALTTLALALLPAHLAVLALVWQLNGDHPTRVVAGLQDDDAYLLESQPYLPAFRAIASHSRAGDRVLMVGESRAFYLDRSAVWGSVVDPPPFAAFAGDPPDPARAAERLRAAGIRFVYFRPSQLRVGVRPPGVPHELVSYVGPELDAAFRALLSSYAHPVLRDRGSWVFALNDVPVAGAPR